MILAVEPEFYCFDPASVEKRRVWEIFTIINCIKRQESGAAICRTGLAGLHAS